MTNGDRSHFRQKEDFAVSWSCALNYRSDDAAILILIGFRIGKWGISKAQKLASSVKNDVKPLHKRHAADEIQPRHGLPEVLHDQVDTVLLTSYGGVQRAGPDLGIRG